MHVAKSQRNANGFAISINDAKYWKANEWKTWILLAVPILHGILPNCFLKHFSKFVDTILILNNDHVTQENLSVASSLSKKFCQLVPQLYNESYCSFNLHIFSHAWECVQNWGPLWGYSLFQFENYNGVLCNSFCGMNQVAAQIGKQVLSAHKLYSFRDSDFMCNEAKDFFVSLIDYKRYMTKAVKAGNSIMLGASKVYFFSDKEKKELSKKALVECQGLAFKSCIVLGKLYGTRKNCTKSRANCIVTSNDQLFLVESIIYVKNYPFGLFLCKKLVTAECKYAMNTVKILLTRKSG